MEGHVRQLHSRDTLPAPAARDAKPVAEGCASGPVASKDAQRIRELAFEGQQRSEIRVATIVVGRIQRGSKYGGQGDQEQNGYAWKYNCHIGDRDALVRMEQPSYHS
jgi:hypothetical protein